MGLVASKTDKTPLINLCKERKELIRAARDARYYLATAHVMYFQSLVDFGNALNQFVQNELIVIPISSDDDDSSGESSFPDCDCYDSDSLLGSSATTVCNRSEVSAGRKPSASNHGGCGDRHCLSRNNGVVPGMKHDQFVQNPLNFDRASISSNDARDRLHKDTYNSQEGIDNTIGDSGFVGNEFKSATMEVQSEGTFFGEEGRATETSSFSAAPPQPSVSAWDFLDVFNVTDYVNCYYKNAEGDEGESDGWREVKEREGIPDLENESGVSSVVELKQRKQRRKIRRSSTNSTTIAKETDEKERTNDTVSFENETGKSQMVSTLTGSENDDAVSVSSGSESLPAEEDDSSRSLGSCLHESGLKDLRYIVNEIHNVFETTFSIGEKVSTLLEVGRLPHQPLGAQFKDFASRVLGLGNLTHQHQNRSNSSSRKLLTHDSTQSTVKENIKSTSNFLSATLEKLYIWEKKLLGEVMVEEKLRALYDKEYKILKNLDKRGAESSEIGVAEASVKRLLSKINVSVRAVESISRRVHEIRDEEMLFQLLDIIHELTDMWKFLAKCHHKQFWEIARSISCVHIVEPDVQKKSSLKATQKLEAQITKYEASFSNYVGVQRAFIRLLNEWLARNILQEQDNGTMPISPTTIGAPEIFKLCNDWWHEIENVSETKVLRAIQELASRFRAVEVMQTEEAQQQIRTKQLQKELTKQTKNLQEVWGVTLPMSYSAEKMITQLGGVGQELLSLRETMAQEKAKHEKVVRELNDAVSASLQEGLGPVFEALEEFCLRNVKAYQNITIRRQNLIC